MAQTDRLYKLKYWLDPGRCVTREFLLRELEISPATLKRDIMLLRDGLNTPLEWDKIQRGWRLDRSQPTVGPQFELPGLWFSAEEIHALLTMQHLLAHLDAGGLLGPHIEPLMKRLASCSAAAHRRRPTWRAASACRPWARERFTCRTSRPWAARCCVACGW